MLGRYETRGRYFEDLTVGDAWLTAGRTITEADIVNFAGVSGDFNPLHVDELYSSHHLYGGRIAHGMCVLSIVTGLFERSGVVEGTILGFIGLDMKWRLPVRAGDSIRLGFMVKAALRGSQADAGIVIFRGEAYNQSDEIVLDGQITALVRRRGEDAGG